MRRLIRILIFLFLLSVPVDYCFAEDIDRVTGNYILVIDNSLSTSGAHSLGSATDPEGLRFDAARLVYENVRSSARSDTSGKIAVIVFCGPENCVVYGPMDIASEPEALHDAIGQYLTEPANQDRRDNYTDIRTALEKAYRMMSDWQGDTSVFLLTDGVNDLTNQADPFRQPENIEANRESVLIAEKMRDLGASFYVIALTDQDSLQGKEDFLAFINQLAKAGGGNILSDGSFGNVLMTTQTDLESRLLQLFVRAESKAAAQTIEQLSNEEWPFIVPYNGIRKASVNLTFMPEDGAWIKAIDLIAPDQTVYALYQDGTAQLREDITVTVDRSYMILGISAPAAGKWLVRVTGDNVQIPVNIVVRFDHNLRLKHDIPESFSADTEQIIHVWLQQYNGQVYENLTDSDIFRLSTAALRLIPLSEENRPMVVKMQPENDHFTAKVVLNRPGEWKAQVRIENDYYVEQWDDIPFTLLGNSAAPLEAETDLFSGGEDDSLIGDTGTDEYNVLIADTGSAEDDVLIADTGSAEDDVPIADTGSAEDNGLVVNTGTDEDAFLWEVEPDDKAEKITVSWLGNGADEAVAELREKGSDLPLISGIHSGDSIDIAALAEEQGYTLAIMAFSGPEDDIASPPPMQELELEVIPNAEEIGGAVLAVADAVIKLAPSLQLDQTNLTKVETDEGSASSEFSADQIENEKSGSASSSEPAENEENMLLSGEKAAEGGISSLFGNALSGIAGKGMAYFAGAAILAVLLAVFFIGKSLGGKRVTGRMKITCDAINLDMLLLFEGRGRIKENSYLTAHPDLAKRKNSKAYDVLSHVKVSMAKADHKGQVSGSEVTHLPNEELIKLTYDNAVTKEQEVCYIGRTDIGDSVLELYDFGRPYEVHFNGNLSFDEITR
ncbi:MAG: VWA domain-containing protein [Blautia sp.]|nr:VWA domain-containing protein [Blautia sp.]